MKPFSFGLDGKVCAITGAAQGIGAACARVFAQQGARLALSDVQATGGQALTEELQQSGHEAHFTHCDVGHSNQVSDWLNAVLDRYGRVDVLVNNAGIFKAAPFLEATEADFDEVLRINLKGAFLVGQAFAKAMASTGGGAIVNMSSVNGVLAIPEIASYNISKGGINQLTRAMALALTDLGIRVNAVAPGTIATDLARQAVLTSESARLRILSRTPMKRLGEPEEVAHAVAFLASDAASYITGEILTIDGGRMALNYTVAL